MPDDNLKLVPFEKESLVLQQAGVKRRFSDKDAPTTEIWRKGCTKNYGRTVLKQVGNGVEEDYVNGIAVKHYN